MSRREGNSKRKQRPVFGVGGAGCRDIEMRCLTSVFFLPGVSKEWKMKEPCCRLERRDKERGKR